MDNLSEEKNDNEKKLAESVSYALDLMKRALENVSTEYVHLEISDEELQKNDLPGDVRKQVERCFAYELYHQLRTIFIKEKPETTIKINAEVPKKVIGKEKIETKYPDIVIHGGQGDNNTNNQLLIAEIKRNLGSINKNNVKEDLQKLRQYIKELCYVSTQNTFQSGCFIMTNIDHNSLVKEVEEIVRKDKDFRDTMSDVKSIITIFSYEIEIKDNKKVPNIESITLDQIMSGIENNHMHNSPSD